MPNLFLLVFEFEVMRSRLFVCVTFADLTAVVQNSASKIPKLGVQQRLRVSHNNQSANIQLVFKNI